VSFIQAQGMVAVILFTAIILQKILISISSPQLGVFDHRGIDSIFGAFVVGSNTH